MFSSSNPHILDYSGTPVGQIYIMKSDGTEVRRFVLKTKPDNIDMVGSYLRDGLIAVEVPVTRDSVDYYIVNSEGVIQKQFPEFSRTASSIAWSPDGKFIAYSPDRRLSDCWRIGIMKSDGLEHKCLMNQKPNTSGYFSEISWSPDGQYIMFSSNLDGDWNIFVIKPDGLGLTQMTNMPGQEGWEVWWAAP